MKKIWIIGLLLSSCIAVVVFLLLGGDSRIDYNTQVKPILNKRCITCHGGVKREANFSFLFRKDALSKAESGKFPIVPGDLEHSELIRRITSHDPEVRMPYKKDPLTQEEIDILRQWIDQGAQWGDHWAYLPVQKQPMPPGSDWTKNDIDKFVLEKMEPPGLDPSPRANKETLLRRLSLDVIGIPADEKLQKQFLTSEDPGAYEALVDSLLNSPHFGERWTAVWMDLARYSDTKGYERDYIRTIWRYRDWLINAFNRDMPYDSFLIEQLAGDLFEHPTDDQFIATAFHRNTMTNDEGGTDNEEFRTAAVLDRVSTTWEALMGTTFACVQCHSHPYDPFRHEEFYKFTAFFNNSRDEDTYDDYPVLRHLEKEDEQKLLEIKNWIKKEISPAKAEEIYTLVKTWQPAINSLQADQYINSALADTKWLVLRNNAQCRLKNVTLTNRNKLIYRSRGFQPGGVWTIHVDQPAGPIIATVNVKKTKGWSIEEIDITPVAGVHDLYFSYVNPNLKNERENGMMFDWFYFTDDSLRWGKENQHAKDFWDLLTKNTPSTPVMMENPVEMKRTTQVFERGNWLVKGDTVEADVPASLLPFPKDAPRNRLGLALWMTDKGNPLTSRTIVNRIWEQIFGVGLVETLEDFGTQGIGPTHPELLDHLSWKLMNDYQWSVKRLIREIVLSATYQQDSKVSPDQLAKDPFNKFYARASRVRLSAEQVRDQTLAVSGLLSNKMFGPGVMPYQPEGIWSSPYNEQLWKKSTGEEQYRRAVYTYWKRTAPYPSMMTFDGSAREVCVARRIRTNTPLQALVTLNDSSYVEAAYHLARRMLEKDVEVSKQIERGYLLALGQKPSKEKLDVLLRLYQQIVSRRGVKPVGTQIPIQQADPQDEALMLVANAILNLDEFITKN